MTFRILESQMETLGQQTQERFLTMMEAFITRHFAEFVATIGADQLPSWLAAALAKAHAGGVVTEPETAQLILLWTVLGLDADERLDWFGHTFHARGLSAAGKLRQLLSDALRLRPDVEPAIRYPELMEMSE